MINIKNRVYILISLFISLAIGSLTIAATDDIIFSEDITVTGVILGSGTTDMTVFASSSAESFDIISGVVTVTNPGSSFTVGSSNVSVGTIVILKSGAMESCSVNVIPGTSSTALPTASGTYTIRPLEAASCDALCSSLTGAATYNVYPTCGAATCSSGYAMSGSGSSATCVVQSSGGGSYTPPATTTNEDDDTTTIQSFITTTDGTKVSSEIKTIKSDSGGITRVEVEAIITTVEDAVDTQIVKLDSSATADVKEIRLDIKKEAIKELVENSSSKEIKVNIISQEATTIQKSSAARGGKFLIGYDVFSIDILVDGNDIGDFTNSIQLIFDISNITDKANLKVYFFNESTDKWEIAGNGGLVAGNSMIIEVNHLTDFGLIKENKKSTDENRTSSLTDREKQMLQIEDDANVVFVSGTDLNMLLIHNNVEKDSEKQAHGMDYYMPALEEGISGFTINNIYTINNFIIYGTITTEKLGAGERAGVVNSYKKAFNKLPVTKEEWADCIAIGNGRWPEELSVSAENKAKEEFKIIYLRDADMSNLNDNAAITVIAYGLRPSDRNMDSETAGIRIFKGIYKYNPSSALDWDIVRAISYSGATRQ